ncbi:MAG: hypothetical protein Q9195_004520 [Heterodermia aff. obscurata]
MYLTASLIALSGLLHQAWAAPNTPEIMDRALQKSCNRDNLLRSFVDPRYSSSASAYCSSYIRPTVKSTATVTTTVTPAGKAKRDFPMTTYPASRLSSACSCILTATPTATTVVTTVTSTVTATSKSCAAVATPIVKNGDFETGVLAPWTLAQTYPEFPIDPQYLTYGIQSPGYGGSKYSVYVNDENGSSYVQVDLSQTLTVCAGQKYQFSAKYYQATTDPQAHVYVYVDDALVTQSPALPINGSKKRSETAEVAEVEDRATPAIVWNDLAGTFTAGPSGTAVLRISFVATDFLGVQWGADNVVVTPA